jgi:hypothetical protein
MSFIDSDNYGSKVPPGENTNTMDTYQQFQQVINELGQVCSESGHKTTYLTVIILILYCYQCYLAYLTEYQDGHLLRNIFRSIFYIPISIHRAGISLIRAIVLLCLFHHLQFIFNRSARAPTNSEQSNPIVVQNRRDEENRENQELEQIVISVPNQEPQLTLSV